MSSLGFETCEGPLASLAKSFGNYVFIEVCCKSNSALSQEAKKKGMSYIGMTDNMETVSVLKRVPWEEFWLHHLSFQLTLVFHRP